MELKEFEYPLVVMDASGRKYGALREWALELAKEDAQEVADMTRESTRVVDVRTGKVVAEANPKMW